MEERLKEAFSHTRYCVETPSERFVLRVGVRLLSFEHWLLSQGASEWAMITAHNPEAIMHSHMENQIAEARLRECVKAQGYRFFESIHRAEAEDWPDEKGILILVPDQSFPHRLAEDFSQLAYLAGQVGHAPVLVWL